MSSPSSEYAGVRTVVTGASSGIGAAVARELATRRARVLLTGRSLQALDRIAGECDQLGGVVETVAGDITSAEVQEEAVGAAVEAWGGLDLLVNNAGISMNARFADMDDEVLREIMEVNFFAAAALTRFALPHLATSHGRIIVMSSVTGLVGTPTRSAYAASKHALHGMFDALRVELREVGVGVTIVCPGFVRSEIRRRALLADGRPQGYDDAEGRRQMAPELVARRVLAAAAAGRRLVLIGAETRGARLLARWAPGLLDSILAKAGR